MKNHRPAACIHEPVSQYMQPDRRRMGATHLGRCRADLSAKRERSRAHQEYTEERTRDVMSDSMMHCITLVPLPYGQMPARAFPWTAKVPGYALPPYSTKDR